MLAVSGTGCRLSPGQTQSQQWMVTRLKQNETACKANITRGQVHILSISTTYVFSMEEAFSTNQQAESCHQLSNQKNA